jgi:hypothetical protein
MFSKGSEASKPPPFDGNDPDCIRAECGADYRTGSGLTVPLHRLGMLHRKPKAISAKSDPTKQAGCVAAYEALMTGSTRMKPGFSSMRRIPLISESAITLHSADEVAA